MPQPLVTAGAYAAIIASNLAANITWIGALAGLMWSSILHDKGVVFSHRAFIRTGLIVTPPVFVLTLIVLYWVLR